MYEDNIFWRNEHRVSLWPPLSNDPLKLADQIIITDGGPWASHNVVCAVCGERGAILDLEVGVFLPCDQCRREGWSLTYTKPNRLINFFKIRINNKSTSNQKII